jgi:hypothetical protein
MLKKQNGWATVELLFTLPVVVLLLGIFVFVGGFYATKLELSQILHESASEVATQSDGDCSLVRSKTEALFAHALTTFDCSSDQELLTIDASYLYTINLPYFENFARPITIHTLAALPQKETLKKLIHKISL